MRGAKRLNRDGERRYKSEGTGVLRPNRLVAAGNIGTKGKYSETAGAVEVKGSRLQEKLARASIAKYQTVGVIAARNIATKRRPEREMLGKRVTQGVD